MKAAGTIVESWHAILREMVTTLKADTREMSVVTIDLRVGFVELTLERDRARGLVALA